MMRSGQIVSAWLFVLALRYRVRFLQVLVAVVISALKAWPEVPG
jgi:hypothetical protein